MSLRDLRQRDLRLIARFSSRYTVRGGTGLVFAILVLICGLMIAHTIITPVEQFKASMKSERGIEMEDEEAVRELLRMARPAVEWAIGSGEHADEETSREAKTKAEEWASFLLDDRPALLSAVVLILLYVMPFLVAIGAFNQFSGDIQTRGLRYQLLRTDRANIFFGRFLGISIFNVGVTALLVGAIVLYLGFKVKFYPWGDVITWGLRGFFALVVVSIPYIALCSWISSSFDAPFGSLVMCKLIVGVIPLLALLGRNTWEPLQYIQYVIPWGIQKFLLHPDTFTLLASVGACLGYSVAFLSIGYFLFSRRDL